MTQPAPLALSYSLPELAHEWAWKDSLDKLRDMLSAAGLKPRGSQRSGRYWISDLQNHCPQIWESWMLQRYEAWIRDHG